MFCFKVLLFGKAHVRVEKIEGDPRNDINQNKPDFRCQHLSLCLPAPFPLAPAPLPEHEDKWINNYRCKHLRGKRTLLLLLRRRRRLLPTSDILLNVSIPKNVDVFSPSGACKRHFKAARGGEGPSYRHLYFNRLAPPRPPATQTPRGPPT